VSVSCSDDEEGVGLAVSVLRSGGRSLDCVSGIPIDSVCCLFWRPTRGSCTVDCEGLRRMFVVATFRYDSGIVLGRRLQKERLPVRARRLLKIFVLLTMTVAGERPWRQETAQHQPRSRSGNPHEK
jgi:hypothetical protein